MANCNDFFSAHGLGKVKTEGADTTDAYNTDSFDVFSTASVVFKGRVDRDTATEERSCNVTLDTVWDWDGELWKR